MVKKEMQTILLVALLLFVPFFQVLAATETSTPSGGDTYYEKGEGGQRHSLTRRMALAGHNCMVSRLADGVEVGTGSANMQNLCDADLSKYYTIPSTVSATLLAGSPIVGVKDMKHFFDKDTKAGFKISGQSDVLKLSVLQNNYMIRFYRDGKILKTSPVEEKGYTVLNLNVGDINIGSDAVDVVASEQPDEDYDEIALVGAAGIDVSLVKGLEIYYAFVGDGEYTLTDTRIKDYSAGMTVTGTSSDLIGVKNLCDDDLTNDATISAVVQLGSSGYAQVVANDASLPEGQQVFPAGTEAGFVISTGGLLDVGVTPTLFLLDRDGKELYKKAVSSTVLGLNISGGEKKLSIKAPCAFSGIKVMMFGVSVANATVARYAFIVPEPTTAGHQCEMSPTASLDLCDCDAHYQLTWDKKHYPNVAWSIDQTTDDAVQLNTTDNTLDFSYCNDDKVTVRLKITNLGEPEGQQCSQYVTVNYGGTDSKQADTDRKEHVLVNPVSGQGDYELGEGISGGVNILSIVKNSSNLLTPKLNDYASYFGGVTIGDSYLCSIHKTTGDISDGSKAVQAGFVVTAKGSALSADVLKLMNVRVYKDGKQVASGVATGAIAAKLIGSEDTHKVRYAIDVPVGTAFDEMRLYSSGLLGADLSVLNIYYAYTADQDAVLDDPMEGADIVSFDNTGASIDGERTQSAGVANVGNGLKDITNCIDGNMDTKTTFPTGLKAASGSVLAVKLGRTAGRNKQLVVVVNKAAVGLGLDVAGAVVVKTYMSGQDEPVETYDDWSVLGANVISIGDKGYIFINPKEDYDEVTITEGKGVSLLSGLEVYGLLLRNDKDADGTPDADEPADDCKQDLVFQESVTPTDKQEKTYKDNITMYFQRTFVGDKWNSLILPVSLTKAQFANAFGPKAKLAGANRLYEAKSPDGTTLHVIGFKEVEANANTGEYLVANTPYIIYIDQDWVNSHSDADKVYSTWDAGDICATRDETKGTVKGGIYIVDKDLEAGGVNFEVPSGRSHDVSLSDQIPSDWTITALDFLGSYNSHQKVKKGDYIFNAGDMYHLSSDHWMQGYRCWMTVQTDDSYAQAAKPLTFGWGQGAATGITHVETIEKQQENKIYNLNGQRVDAMTGLKPGVFIVNGKKMIVR